MDIFDEIAIAAGVLAPLLGIRLVARRIPLRYSLAIAVTLTILSFMLMVGALTTGWNSSILAVPIACGVTASAIERWFKVLTSKNENPTSQPKHGEDQRTKDE